MSRLPGRWLIAGLAMPALALAFGRVGPGYGPGGGVDVDAGYYKPGGYDYGGGFGDGYHISPYRDG